MEGTANGEGDRRNYTKEYHREDGSNNVGPNVMYENQRSLILS